MWSGSFSHRIQNAKVRIATALTPNQALEQTRDSVLRYGELVGRELLNFFVQRLPLLSHPLSAPNASDLLPKGPNTGPSTGPMSAHQ